MSNTEFVEGLRIYAPHERAPDYIIANGEIDGAVLGAWLASHPGKVRIVIKRSQGGKYYAAVDTYKRDAQPAPQRERPAAAKVVADASGFIDDEIPFAPCGKHTHWIA